MELKLTHLAHCARVVYKDNKWPCTCYPPRGVRITVQKRKEE